jgi:hypothetical protein
MKMIDIIFIGHKKKMKKKKKDGFRFMEKKQISINTCFVTT